MTYADIHGLSLYYQEHGEGGTPLVLLHGGMAGGEIFAGLLPALAEGRRVIVPDLQGHGRTAEIDRPLRPEHLAGDIVAPIGQLGLERADVMGYSLGSTVALRLAVQHPELVRRLVLVSTAVRRDGSFPEVVAAMDAMSAEIAPMMQGSPAYQHYAEVAPRPEDWAVHVGRTAELLKVPYDWTGDVAGLQAPTMLVYADADSVRPEHILELWGLLGGGRRDAGWDGSARPQARLAVLPGTTHYDIYLSPLLAPAIVPFLDER